MSNDITLYVHKHPLFPSKQFLTCVSVSPSVYIGFSSLYAYDYCGTVGQPLINTTVAFDQDELSTIQYVVQYTTMNETTNIGTGTSTVWSTYSTTSSYYTSTTPAPLNYEVLGQNCSTISGYTYVPGNPSAALIYSCNFLHSCYNHAVTDRCYIAMDPCHPIIVVPDRIKSLQPAWNSCGSDAVGGYVFFFSRTSSPLFLLY